MVFILFMQKFSWLNLYTDRHWQWQWQWMSAYLSASHITFLYKNISPYKWIYCEGKMCCWCVSITTTTILWNLCCEACWICSTINVCGVRGVCCVIARSKWLFYIRISHDNNKNSRDGNEKHLHGYYRI